MFVLPKGPVAYFDVDDTLIEWVEAEEGGIVIECEKWVQYKKPILENVRELKLQKGSGTFIVVWSASGSQWAEAVVKALKLEKYVDVCLTKPIRLYDDRAPIDWLPETRNLARTAKVIFKD